MKKIIFALLLLACCMPIASADLDCMTENLKGLPLANYSCVDANTRQNYYATQICENSTCLMCEQYENLTCFYGCDNYTGTCKAFRDAENRVNYIYIFVLICIVLLVAYLISKRG